MKLSKGFTLIELLVVVAIIGVLASIVLSSLSSARGRAIDSKRLTNVKSLQKALELYHLDNGVYPQAYTNVGDLRAANCSDTSTVRWDALMTELSPYMSAIPYDQEWPLCTYYFTGSQFTCNHVTNPEYTIIFASEESLFDSFDFYSQNELNTRARYCVYPI